MIGIKLNDNERKQFDEVNDCFDLVAATERVCWMYHRYGNEASVEPFCNAIKNSIVSEVLVFPAFSISAYLPVIPSIVDRMDFRAMYDVEISENTGWTLNKTRTFCLPQSVCCCFKAPWRFQYLKAEVRAAFQASRARSTNHTRTQQSISGVTCVIVPSAKLRIAKKLGVIKERDRRCRSVFCKRRNIVVSRFYKTNKFNSSVPLWAMRLLTRQYW